MNKPRKFRKRPVIIEAMRWDGDLTTAQWIARWARGHCGFMNIGDPVVVTDDPCGIYISVRTLEGTMHAQQGDWIIKGLQGEFYPCKPDIFAATYEEADE
ncbi:MAG: hypothetical protein LBH13_06505 [Cellulomonadaceae bacterium]|jgi:hypothetical protein|nr:hypothetical protein [Cellulomonadaceae bacterium]